MPVFNNPVAPAGIPMQNPQDLAPNRRQLRQDRVAQRHAAMAQRSAMPTNVAPAVLQRPAMPTTPAPAVPPPPALTGQAALLAQLQGQGVPAMGAVGSESLLAQLRGANGANDMFSLSPQQQELVQQQMQVSPPYMGLGQAAAALGGLGSQNQMFGLMSDPARGQGVMGSVPPPYAPGMVSQLSPYNTTTQSNIMGLGQAPRPMQQGIGSQLGNAMSALAANSAQPQGQAMPQQGMQPAQGQQGPAQKTGGGGFM